MQTPETAAATTSLSEFVTRHDKLLAAIGVFVALSAFFTSLPLKGLTTLLAFVSLIATFPLLFELVKDLWKSKSSWSLLIFSNIFFIFLGYFSWYVLIAFRDQWWTQMNKVVFWGLFLGLLGIYRQFFRPTYQRGFSRLGFYVEGLATLLWRNVLGLQLRIWSASHFLKSVFIFGRHRFSALRWKVRNQRRLKSKLASLKVDYEHSRIRRWRTTEPSDELKVLGTIILFVPIYFAVGQIQNPAADLINIFLDIQAEEYKREEKVQPRKRLPDLDSVPVPPDVHDR